MLCYMLPHLAKLDVNSLQLEKMALSKEISLHFFFDCFN